MAETIANPIKRYPIVFFYLLAFLFSWPADLVPGENAILEILGVAGPTLAAVIVANVLYGKQGSDNLFARLFHWRVGFIWYVVAIILPFLIGFMTVGVLVTMGETSVQTVFQMPWSLFPALLIQRLLVNVWEEIGWRGFALPKLQENYRALVASLIVGVLWAVWHVPSYFFSESVPAEIPFLPYFLEFIFASVIYTWIYNNTGGSILLVTLFHVFSNVSDNLIGEAGVNLGSYFIVHAVLSFLVALALTIIYGPESLKREEEPAPTFEHLISNSEAARS